MPKGQGFQGFNTQPISSIAFFIENPGAIHARIQSYRAQLLSRAESGGRTFSHPLSRPGSGTNRGTRDDFKVNQ